MRHRPLLLSVVAVVILRCRDVVLVRCGEVLGLGKAVAMAQRAEGRGQTGRQLERGK